MANSADRYRDALIQHAMELQGVSNALVLRIIASLNETERELIQTLRDHAEEIGVGAEGLLATKRERIEEMLTAVLLIRDLAWKKLHGTLQEELLGIAKFESGFTKLSVEDAIAILEVQLGTPTAAQLRLIVTQEPFRGRRLREWTLTLAGDDLGRLRATILQAVAEGASVEDLVQRVRGTRAQNFTDGILQVGRVGAATIARTALSHVQNGAREAVFQENADIIDGLIWIATLDGRTTEICANLDGSVAPFPGKTVPDRPLLDPPGRRPPAHFNCRSVMGAWFNAIGIVGSRPYVTSTLGNQERRIVFRDRAKQKAGADWKGLTRSERNALVAKEREAWALQNIGTVPAKTTFREFFDRAPASFQRDWLGATRYRLFRDGGLEISSFVDLQTGKQLTLDQLLRIHRPAFKKAGLL